MPALQGKVAIITGGSSGIGLAIAKRFVSEGAYIFITSRRQSELDKAVAEIGKSVTAIQGDVSKLEDLDRLYSVVSSEGRRIDVVVANAGFVGMAQSRLRHLSFSIRPSIQMRAEHSSLSRRRCRL